jgi:DNA-binding HxlR family transcriptional regulator
LVFPTTHRAQSEIYVAYNADAIYRNPDDYKNWQFSELEAYIVSNDVLDETLKRLVERDPYWRTVSNDQLREHLRIYWRDAGKWRLVAEWHEQAHATHLAQAWTDVVMEKTSQAAEHAREVLMLDAQVKAYARDEVNLRLFTAQLSQLRNALQVWRDAQIPRQSQPLERLDRWRLEFLAASVEGLVPVELALVEQLPSTEAAGSEYFPVVDQALTALDAQIEIVNSQYTELTTQLNELKNKLNEETNASHNLTASLSVEPFSNGVSTAQPVRLTSQMALVGGVLGVLTWGLAFLGKLIRKAGRFPR